MTGGSASADVYVMSFPKCGRTWLRLLIVKALADGFGLGMDLGRDLEPAELAAAAPDSLPTIAFLHAGDPGGRTPAELSTSARARSWYADRRIVFMTRDLRDVVVSFYFQRTRRDDNPYRGTLSDFLTEERGGLRSAIAYWNGWHADRHTPAAFLATSYERLSTDPVAELGRVLAFAGVPSLGSGTLAAAARYGDFANMRMLESTDALATERLRPGDPADPESYKTRRGVVGGYRDYLTPGEIDLVNDLVMCELTPDLWPAAFASDDFAAAAPARRPSITVTADAHTGSSSRQSSATAPPAPGLANG